MAMLRTTCFPEETKTSQKHEKNLLKVPISSFSLPLLIEVLMTWQFSSTKRTTTFQLIQLPLFPVGGGAPHEIQLISFLGTL